MSERPAAVRIDDLADPQLPPNVAAMLDGAAALADQVELSSDALLGQARAETGLDDFGPGDFRERLDVLVHSFGTEAGLNPLGRMNAYGLLLSLLKNRLRVEDLVARHPEILDVEIARPIVICGLPRTGTTHLHNLMSADAGLRSLPYWESLEPVLAPSEQPPPGAPDPRIVRTDAAARVPQRRVAVLQADARDDDMARPRRDPTARDRLLDDAVRHRRAGAVVA